MTVCTMQLVTKEPSNEASWKIVLHTKKIIETSTVNIACLSFMYKFNYSFALLEGPGCRRMQTDSDLSTRCRDPCMHHVVTIMRTQRAQSHDKGWDKWGAAVSLITRCCDHFSVLYSFNSHKVQYWSMYRVTIQVVPNLPLT